MSFADMLHRNEIIHPKNRPAPPDRTRTTEIMQQDPPHSCFISPLIANQLAVLHNLADKSRVIVITGEHGIGKTTFIRRFMLEGTRKWRSSTIRFIATRRSSAHQHYQAVQCRIFVSETGALPSVIIDDAHRLGPMELRAIIHGVCPLQGQAVLGSVILVADASIRKHTDAMLGWMPADTAMEKMHLSPLTEAQTARYLRHQLKNAGCVGKLPLTNAQTHRVYQNSGGIPALIDSQVDLLLNHPTADERGSAVTLLKWLRKKDPRRTKQWHSPLQSVRN